MNNMTVLYIRDHDPSGMQPENLPVRCHLQGTILKRSISIISFFIQVTKISSSSFFQILDFRNSIRLFNTEKSTNSFRDIIC